MIKVSLNWKALLIFNILLAANPENSSTKPTPSNVLHDQGKCPEISLKI